MISEFSIDTRAVPVSQFSVIQQIHTLCGEFVRKVISPVFFICLLAEVFVRNAQGLMDALGIAYYFICTSLKDG